MHQTRHATSWHAMGTLGHRGTLWKARGKLVKKQWKARGGPWKPVEARGQQVRNVGLCLCRPVKNKKSYFIFYVGI